MAKVNVAQFATELKLSADKLVEQLKAAGVKKALTEETALTEGDKTKLLEYLRKAHGAKDGKSKITLTRRQTSEIRKSDGSGKARTIQVEVPLRLTLDLEICADTQPLAQLEPGLGCIVGVDLYPTRDIRRTGRLTQASGGQEAR